MTVPSRIFLGLVAVAIASCSGEVDDAKAVVREQLVDGQSARFENVVVQKTMMDGDTIVPADKDAVCGWVNSKNRMGAYAGAERFVVKDGVPTFGDASNEEWSNAFMMCIIHSDNQAASDRLSREGQRLMDEIDAALDQRE